MRTKEQVKSLLLLHAEEDEIFSLETNKHAEALDTFKIHE
jgi:hypothetical protein